MTPFLKKTLENVAPSSTMALNQKVRSLQQEGTPIINLGIGQPDVPVPDWIKKGTFAAIEGPYNRYTAVDGCIETKEAIIRKYKRCHGITFKPNEVIVSTGAKQSIYNAFMATLNPGDEVILPAPYWSSYPDMVKLAEGSIIEVACPLEANFKITPDQLMAAISPQTKWIVINSPGNPTGSVYSKEELKSLEAVLKNYPQVHILADEVYEEQFYKAEPFSSFLKICPSLKDRTLTVNSFSKSFSMAGWRLGYGVGPAPLIEAMKTIQSQSTSCPSTLSQEAGRIALDHFDPKIIQETCALYQSRRDIVHQKLGQIPELEINLPEGAFYFYIKCEKLIGRKTPEGLTLKTDADVALYFLESGKVALLPGNGFGLSPFLRLSYAAPKEDLIKACENLKLSINALV